MGLIYSNSNQHHRYYKCRIQSMLTLILLIVCVFGVHTTEACSGEDLKLCTADLLKVSQNGMKMDGELAGQDENEYACGLVKKAVDCMKREIATCPPKMDSMIKSSMLAIDVLGKVCKDPKNVHVSLNISQEQLQTCNSEELKACTDRLNFGAPENLKEICRSLGEAKECYKSFKKNCKSEYLNKLISSQDSNIRAMERKCQRSGYSHAIVSDRSDEDGNDARSSASCTWAMIDSCMDRLEILKLTKKDYCPKLEELTKCVDEVKQCPHIYNKHHGSQRVIFEGQEFDLRMAVDHECKNSGFSVRSTMKHIIGPLLVSVLTFLHGF